MAYEEELVRFRRWFVAPISKLKELSDGDGAFAALMIAMPLYERFIVASLKLAGTAAETEGMKAAINQDLGLNDAQRKRFWAIFRDGFMHQGMGQAGKTQWQVSHVYGERPVFKTFDGVDTVSLDPWKFAERVLNEFVQRPELIVASESFPFAEIFLIPPDELHDHGA